MTVAIQPYSPPKLGELEELLQPLTLYYPNFFDWLHTKLATPNIHAHIAVNTDNKIVGVVIGGLNSPHVYKISTLYVTPAYQNQGIGTEMLFTILSEAKTTPATEVYISSDSTLLKKFDGFLHPHGFVPLFGVPNKYRHGNTEIYYYKYL